MKNKTDYQLQVLSRIINNSDYYYQNMHLVNAGMFPRYIDIFKFVVETYAKGSKPGIDFLMQKFPGKENELLDMMSDVDYTIADDYVIQQLIEEHRLSIIRNNVTEMNMANTSEEKEKILSRCVSDLQSNQTKRVLYPIHEVIGNVIEKIDQGIETGFKTGFSKFDNLTGGLQPSDLVIIAASSSMGKTSLAVSISKNLLIKNIPHAFLSMELSKNQLAIRLFSAVSKSPLFMINEFKNQLNKFKQTYLKSKLYLADIQNNDIRNIEGVIRNSVLNHGIKVVFIDYLQLLRNSEIKNREQEIGFIARRLKNIAKELDIPIVALSQLSREKDSEKPSLYRLRDSGQIEEAADIVWFVWRPDRAGVEQFTYFDEEKKDNVTENTHNRAMHIIAKGRNYGTAEFTTAFEKRYAAFIDDNYTEQSSGNTASTEGTQSETPF